MVCINSNSFLLLATFILISSSFSPRCHGENTQFPHRHAMHSEGMADLGGHGVVFLETGRSVLENGDSERNRSLILAAKRTKRIDPLHHFKHYKGGWNISNRNYFSSVGFTAAPLFLISAFWFLGFGIYLLIICFRHCCSQRQHYVHEKIQRTLLSFLMLFTTATIVGCVVLYTGQGKFHSSTTSTLEYIVKQSNSTVQNLKNVSYYLSTAKQLGVDQYFMPSNVQANIDNIQIKINASTTFLEEKKDSNSDRIQHVLDSVQLALIIIAAVMLLLSLTGFFCSVLNLQLLVYILATIAWILVAGTFILCGVFLLLHNVAADTCVAMNEWVQHPTARTALDDILLSKDVTFQLVNVVNNFITNVSNKNFPTQAELEPSVSYNQTGPLVPVLCNPYQPNKTRRVCEAGEVDFNNAAQEWNKYICEVSADGICTTPGRLTPKLYNQMSTAANVSTALYHHGTFLAGLQDCSFVRKTFTDIIKDYCPGLRRYSEWIYIGLTMVSSAVLLSLIIWISYTRPKRGKEYIRQYADMPSQDSLQLQKGMKK
ncbi:hypothetical protein AAG906_040545 [Vitis piasezkii]